MTRCCSAKPMPSFTGAYRANTIACHMEITVVRGGGLLICLHAPAQHAVRQSAAGASHPPPPPRVLARAQACALRTAGCFDATTALSLSRSRLQPHSKALASTFLQHNTQTSMNLQSNLAYLHATTSSLLSTVSRGKEGT